MQYIRNQKRTRETAKNIDLRGAASTKFYYGPLWWQTHRVRD